MVCKKSIFLRHVNENEKFWSDYYCWLVILTSCGDYNKILKSTDYEFKYKKAIEYYEDGNM